MMIISALYNFKLAYSLLDFLKKISFFQNIVYLNQIDHA